MTDRRTLPRLSITPSQFYSAKFHKSFSIQDLSVGGVSLHLIDRNDLQFFAVGSEHKGTLKVEGARFEVQFKVKYIQGLGIGAAWEQATPELVGHIKKITDPGYLGASLKKMDLQDHSGFLQDANMAWYHAPVGMNLIVYGQKRWVLFFYQTFVQWDSEMGITTGKAAAEDEQSVNIGIIRLETRLLEYDRKPDQRILELAYEALNATQVLERDIQQNILTQIKKEMTGVI